MTTVKWKPIATCSQSVSVRSRGKDGPTVQRFPPLSSFHFGSAWLHFDCYKLEEASSSGLRILLL